MVIVLQAFQVPHSEAATIDELDRNLREVIEMLFEDSETELISEYVGTKTMVV